MFLCVWWSEGKGLVSASDTQNRAVQSGSFLCPAGASGSSGHGSGCGHRALHGGLLLPRQDPIQAATQEALGAERSERFL